MRAEKNHIVKVFSLLDRAVQVNLDDVRKAFWGAVEEEEHISPTGSGSPVDIEVHDGERFLPLTLNPVFTRYAFLLIRVSGRHVQPHQLLYSPLARMIADWETEDRPEDLTFITQGFSEGRAALNLPPVLLGGILPHLGPGIRTVMDLEYGSSLRRIQRRITGARIRLIPSCWLRYQPKPFTGDPVSCLWVDADCYGWVDRTPSVFDEEVTIALGGAREDRSIMLTESAIFASPFTEAGKICLILHELAHHLEGEAEGPRIGDPHDFWFHLCFLVLLRSVFGRTRGVLDVLLGSLRSYHEDGLISVGTDDRVPLDVAAHLAMILTDTIFHHAHRARGRVRYEDLITPIAVSRRRADEAFDAEILFALRNADASPQLDPGVKIRQFKG